MQSQPTTTVDFKESSLPAEHSQNELQGHIQDQANHEKQIHNSEAIDIPTASKGNLKASSIASEELSKAVAKNESLNEQPKALRLLRFADDLAQYKGDKLWVSMLERCHAHFQDASKYTAFMSLQRLRRGKVDAETVFKILCELCGRDPTFCRMLQHYLGILESYPGGSLLRAPFDVFDPPQDSLSSVKPQNRCLTCIEKGRECSGSHRIEGSCYECHTDKVNSRTAFGADKCYWVHDSHGILTYSDAVDFFSYDDEISTSKKRKATDDANSPRPKKKGRKTNNGSVITQYFKSPWGTYPINLEHSRHPIPEPGSKPKRYTALLTRKLVDAQGVELTDIGSMVSLEKFRGIRAALEWDMWDLIKWHKLVNTFTFTPNYSFSYRHRDGRKIKIDEFWFLSQDRAIRTGKANFEDATFYCEARPPTETS